MASLKFIQFSFIYSKYLKFSTEHILYMHTYVLFLSGPLYLEQKHYLTLKTQLFALNSYKILVCE